MATLVIFNLKRFWEIDGKTVELYKEIKAGRKTSEYRDLTHFWIKRLCEHAHWESYSDEPQDLTKYLRIHRAWFVVGYPKGNVPRLEAEIIGLFCDSNARQLEIKFANVIEVTVNP